jgi:hypothetical protein
MAKGMEADHIYLIMPELLPHPLAKKDWEKVQERNLKFIAYTRNRKSLRIVHSDLPPKSK